MSEGHSCGGGDELLLRWIPVFRHVSSGFVIIICAVAASALGAWLYPVKEEEG